MTGRFAPLGPIRVAVVGGAGFIGSNLVDRLADAGHEVTVFDIAPPPARSSSIAFGPTDITVQQQMRGRFRGFDRIFLLAGVLERGCRERPVESWRVNVLGTANVVAEALETTPTPALCFFSSARVYRPGGRRVAMPEQGAVEGDTAYAAGKLAGEQMIRSAAGAGLGAVIFRPFSVYGPGPAHGDRGHFVATWLERAAARQPLQVFGGGDQVVDLVHVADVARLCVLWLRLDVPPGEVRTFNLGSGHPATVSEVARWFREERPGLRVERAPAARAATWEGFADMSQVEQFFGWRPATAPEDGVRTLVRDCLERSPTS